jgi:uncharacterized protein (DUF362 family)
MRKHQNRSNAKSRLSRRDFLRLAGSVTTGFLVQACRSRLPDISPEKEPTKTAAAPVTPSPVATQPPPPTATPTVTQMPTVQVTPSPVATQPLRPTATPTALKTTTAQVAIGQVKTYDRDAIERQLQNVINELGGLGDVVKPGDSVAIKTNLTGGITSGRLPTVGPVESFVTHPEVVRALVKQVQRAGAKAIFIVEAVYEWESYRQWGYEDIANDLKVSLIDLNDTKPYQDFIEATVGADSFVYPSFIFNRILTEVDVFMSVSKMKNHYYAGVTHTMKNLYGLVPCRFYRLNSADTYRTGFHGTEAQTQSRLPRIIVDLNRARPIHFSLIDGIKTTQGGEGPWISTSKPIEPGVLIAGKNCVATDAVATAVMGHDPTGNYPDTPYLRCDNHLNLAAVRGLGANRLEKIKVLGGPIDKVKMQFSPAG